MNIESIMDDTQFYKTGIFIKNEITNEIKYYSYIKNFNKNDFKNLKKDEIFIKKYNNIVIVLKEENYLS